MNFLDWSNSMGIREATDWGNAIIWSYTAGHEYAPEVMKQVVVKAISLSSVPTEFQQFQGASFSATFKDPFKAAAILMNMMRQFAI